MTSATADAALRARPRMTRDTVWWFDALDALRRRGVNISSIEVEALVNDHPQVAESAAVAVPVEGEEDEVLVVVVPNESAAFPPMERFYQDLEKILPRSMLPHYIRLVDELPKTEATSCIHKAKLRAAGVTEDTWNRPRYL